jgi:hypothetical protein
VETWHIKTSAEKMMNLKVTSNVAPRFKFAAMAPSGRGCVETPLVVAYIEPTRLSEVAAHEAIH